MAKIITTEPINWGGFNSLILNKIQIELKELSRSSENVVYQVRDTAMVENTYIDDNNIEQTYLVENSVIRNKTLSISKDEYNTLFTNADAYTDATYPNLSVFEKEEIRPKVALLLYFQNDLLPNGLCGYNTQPSQWTLIS